jgi:hypothetical protein
MQAWQQQVQAILMDRQDLIMKAIGLLRQDKRLTWSAYDGRVIKLRQGKTDIRVAVPVGKPLKALLDTTPRRAPQIVLNEDGHPFTSTGFRASFRATRLVPGSRALPSMTCGGRLSRALPWPARPRLLQSPVIRFPRSNRSSIGIIWAAWRSLVKALSASSNREQRIPTSDPTTPNCSSRHQKNMV